MTASNHAITGASIAAAIGNPFIALPVALVAHFALDSLPHFGVEEELGVYKSRLFYIILAIDSIALLSLVLFLLFGAPTEMRWLLIAGAVACAIPDVVWIKELITGTASKGGWLKQFHRNIQWGEREWGYLIEIVWFLLFSVVLYQLLF